MVYSHFNQPEPSFVVNINKDVFFYFVQSRIKSLITKFAHTFVSNSVLWLRKSEKPCLSSVQYNFSVYVRTQGLAKKNETLLTT